MEIYRKKKQRDVEKMSKIGGSVSRSKSGTSTREIKLTHEEISQINQHFKEEKNRVRKAKKKAIRKIRENYFIDQLEKCNEVN